jgi:hypothetical protein
LGKSCSCWQCKLETLFVPFAFQVDLIGHLMIGCNFLHCYINISFAIIMDKIVKCFNDGKFIHHYTAVFYAITDSKSSLSFHFLLIPSTDGYSNEGKSTKFSLIALTDTHRERMNCWFQMFLLHRMVVVQQLLQCSCH